MASQRIVFTSPWKLGLFVFLLVVGCGFGLVYAYLTIFGGSLNFADERALRTFYIVCGSVAALGLLGYLAVVSSSRPMEGIVRGNKRREKLLKRFAQIKNAQDAEPKDFADEPALQDVLERWIADSGAASDAMRNFAAQRQAIAALAESLRSYGSEGALLPPSGDQPELNRLVQSINELIQHHSASPAREAGAVHPTEAASPQWQQVGERLRGAQQQIVAFADSIAASAESLHHGFGEAGGGSDCAAAILHSGVADAVARATQRLATSRQHLETLAEESNRLAIAAALQVSRLGEPGAELLRVTEEIRTLSTRYQRLASELRLSEDDHELLVSEWNQLAQRAGAAGGDPVRDLATVLEQNAGGLEELASQLAHDVQTLTGIPVPPRQKRAARPPKPKLSREITPPIVRQQPRAVQRPEPPVAEPAVRRAPAAAAPRPTPKPAPVSAPVVPISGPRRPVEVAQEAEEIYEMAELGGRELDESGEPIYELLEFGAVQL